MVTTDVDGATTSAEAKEHDQTTHTIEALLFSSRRQISELFRTRVRGREVSEGAIPATTGHPLYHNLIKTERSALHQYVTRSQIHSTISDMRRGLRNFMTNAGKEDPSEAANIFSTNDKGNYTITNTSEAEKDESMKKSNERKLLLVSSLREQTIHSLAMSRVRDKLEEVVGGNEREIHSCWEALARNALSSEESVSSLWPTTDSTIASNGLHNLVQSLESLAKEMSLESFSERHEGVTTEGQTELQLPSYTLTFAAHILVIDVDLSLHEQESHIFKPNAKVRISYATDASSAEPKHRNSSLARLIEQDIVGIACSQFGLEDGEDENRRRALEHLYRLRSTVKELKRLDDLSAFVNANGYADLFALMEDKAAETLIRTISSEKSLVSIRVLRDNCSPYASVVYHANPSQLAMSDDQLSLYARESRSSQALYTFKLDIDTCQLRAKADDFEAEHVQLPTLNTTNRDMDYQFVIRLQPALVIQIPGVRQLTSALGLSPSTELPKDITQTSVPGKYPTSTGKSLQAFFQNLNNEQDSNLRIRFATQEDDVETAIEDVILLNTIPIASYRQLFTIIPILQRQARLNALLSTLAEIIVEEDGLSSVLERFEDLEAVIFIKREDNNTAPFVTIVLKAKDNQTSILTATIKEQDPLHWTLNVNLEEVGAEQDGTIPDKEIERISKLLSKPKGGLRSVIFELARYVQSESREGETSEIMVEQNKQSNQEKGKRSKRRASEAGIADEDEHTVRPSNRARNEIE